jgi:ADP-heptose:LPS heptosyltransferase
VLFTTPAIGALRRRFPDARLTYVVEPAAEPLVRHNPHLDEIVVAERPRGLGRLRYDLHLARRLRSARFDVAIDFHGGPRAAWLALASGARRRIGYGLPGRRWVYTDRIPWTCALVPPRHSVLNQWDLLQPLGVGPADPARDPVTVIEDADAAARVAVRLTGASVSDAHRLVVVHVSASNPFRRWPRDAFAEVAAGLAREDPRRRIIITSGPSETDAADEVARLAEAQAGDVAPAIVRCGEFDLLELRSLVARAALFIGGDSGPLHLASSTRTPIVALFGPTLPDRSLPWRDRAVPSIAVDAGPLPCRPCHQRHCVPGDFRCLTRISPEAVLKAARSVMGTG